MQRFQKLTGSEKGVALVEYALFSAILLAVFIAASVYLSDALSRRSEQSAGIASEPAPCIRMLSVTDKPLSGSEPPGCVPSIKSVCENPSHDKYDELCYCCYP